MAVIQSPVALPDWRLLVLVLVVGVITAVVSLAPERILLLAAAAGLGLAALALVTQAGPAEVWRTDWPVLALGALGFVMLLYDESRRRAAMVVGAAVLVLGAVYVLKNPTLPRYFSLVLPAAALLAGLAVGSAPRVIRPLALGTMAGAAVLGLVLPDPREP